MSSSDELASSSSSSSVEVGSRAKSSKEVSSDGAGEVIIEGDPCGYAVGSELRDLRVGRLGVDLDWPAGSGNGLPGGPLLWGGIISQ